MMSEEDSDPDAAGRCYQCSYARNDFNTFHARSNTTAAEAALAC